MWGESDYGIFLDSSTNATILQNDLHVSEPFPIVLSESDDNTLFLDRVNVGDSGITLTSSLRNVLIRNTVTRIDLEGILLDGDSRFNGLVQNTVEHCEYGVVIGRSRWNALVSNRITDDADGVTLTNATQNLLLRNEVRDNFGLGVALNDSDENVLLKNVVCHSADAGSDEQIEIDESIGNRLVENQTTCRAGDASEKGTPAV